MLSETPILMDLKKKENERGPANPTTWSRGTVSHPRWPVSLVQGEKLMTIKRLLM